MSSNPDKAIFSSAIALTVASGAYFLVGAEAPVVKDVSVARNAPATVEIPNVSQPLSVWGYPKEQRSLPQQPKANIKPVAFVLNVFNSPKLYFDPATNTWQLIGTVPPPPPFPFELKDVYQKPFRLQFGSYVQVGANDVTVYLKDLEHKTEIEVKQDMVLPELGITVTSARVEEVTENGGINKIGVIEILDNRSRRTYKLVEKADEIKEPTWYAKVIEISAPKKDIEVVLGGKLTHNGVTYTVKSLDDSSRTISFEWQTPEMKVPETTGLTAPKKEVPKPQPAVAPKTQPAATPGAPKKAPVKP